MVEAASNITRAARQHEAALKAALYAAEHDNPWEEMQIGEAYSPLSQALTDWRGLMSNLYQITHENSNDLAELATTLKTWK